MTGRVTFVGAGPGAADLITVRGADALRAADVVVWAASLVHPDVLAYAAPICILSRGSGRRKCTRPCPTPLVMRTLAGSRRLVQQSAMWRLEILSLFTR